MTGRRAVMLTVLSGVALVSAVAVIEAKHQSRVLQSELQVLRVERDRLRTEWSQLQLEESAWANPDRVARMAREQLNMQVPRHFELLEGQP
ncbi:cell division protein FtsL [Spectribacter hydrogenoxidans]|uniref:Cell division protein FtsL n=1 Tax=Spectribacter hydrogenoxidans TaxID=3075608 RepID=A0ABU3BX33_9GAMM|nr:cell division protein FtsL [Salinisphaera sp. W335]MDT0633868.1 cell division protein FtsL [Salinisphaera sp. W335]